MVEAYPFPRTAERRTARDVRSLAPGEQTFVRRPQSRLGSIVDDIPFGLGAAPIEAIYDEGPEHQLPFGSFAPSLPQAALIALANHTPLGRGRARWFIGSLIEKLRPGPLDVERLGLNMRLHYYGRDTSDKRALLHVNSYDREEIRALGRAIPDQGCFVDIGAHTGFYSLAVKSKRPDVHVVAFEPQPLYCSRFRFNVKAAGLANVRLLTAAVGPQSGLRPFFLEQESLVGSGSAIQVPVVPLYETLMQRGFTQIDALKIDIEGYEDRVLFPFFQKAPSTMWPKAMVIEHCARRAWKHDCLSLAQNLGYREIYVGKANTVLLRHPVTSV